MTFNELIDQINTMLADFASEVGNDITGNNTVDDVRFDNPGGTWVNTPTNPLTTSAIDLSLTNAVSTGTSSIYYQGNVLTKDSFNGGTVISFSGSNRVGVLCFVWVSFDKGNNCFHVNVQDSYTEDIPSGNIENPPTNLVLTLEESAAAVENAPTNLVLTEEEI